MISVPSHKFFIERFICWERVEFRLEEHPFINRLITAVELKKFSETSPYYCHWLAWRLGTWSDESLFEFLNQLIETAQSLEGWNNDIGKDKISSCEFAEFWSFLWELQVVEYFHSQGMQVKWTNSGPDLKVQTKSGPAWVECYVYRKSFGLEEWIQEIFNNIDPKIKVGHTPCIQFSLPQNQRLEQFLDQLFRPFLNSNFLTEKRIEADKQYPVPLPIPDGIKNLHIYLEGNGEYQPRIVPSNTGSTGDFFHHSINEAIRNKADSNSLKNHRPNILAVNFLLGEDFQLAQNRALDLGENNQIDFQKSIDGILIGTCGIDSKLSRNNSKIEFSPSAPPSHPLRPNS